MASVQGQCLVTLKGLHSAVLEKQQSWVGHPAQGTLPFVRVRGSGLGMVGGWDRTLMTKGGFWPLG